MKKSRGWGQHTKLSVFLVALSIAGCVTPRTSQGRHPEHVLFSIDAIPLYSKEFNEKDYGVDLFVIDGLSIDDWTTAVAVFTMPRRNNIRDAETFFRLQKELWHKKCPKADINIIEQHDNSILWETTILGCPPGQDEHSITRVLFGETDIFELIYTNRVKVLPSKEREKWIRSFAAAKIKAGE